MRSVLPRVVPSLTSGVLVASLVFACSGLSGPRAVPAADGSPLGPMGAPPLPLSRVHLGLASSYGRPLQRQLPASGHGGRNRCAVPVRTVQDVEDHDASPWPWGAGPAETLTEESTSTPVRPLPAEQHAPRPARQRSRRGALPTLGSTCRHTPGTHGGREGARGRRRARVRSDGWPKDGAEGRSAGTKAPQGASDRPEEAPSPSGGHGRKGTDYDNYRLDGCAWGHLGSQRAGRRAGRMFYEDRGGNSGRNHGLGVCAPGADLSRRAAGSRPWAGAAGLGGGLSRALSLGLGPARRAMEANHVRGARPPVPCTSGGPPAAAPGVSAPVLVVGRGPRHVLQWGDDRQVRGESGHEEPRCQRDPLRDPGTGRDPGPPQRAWRCGWSDRSGTAAPPCAGLSFVRIKVVPDR